MHNLGYMRKKLINNCVYANNFERAATRVNTYADQL